MLKKLILENWKSFRYAELYFDPLTVLIGTNASGKSNLVEALEFLRRMATGETVDVALNGDRSLPSIRGGSHEVILKSSKSNEPWYHFTLGLSIQDEKQIEYFYRLKIGSILTALPQSFSIRSEDILWNNDQNKISLSGSDFNLNSFVNTSGLLIDYKTLALSDKIENRELGGDLLSNTIINPEIRNQLNLEKPKLRKFVYEQLKSIFIINPLPNQMRTYTQISENRLFWINVKKCIIGYPI